MKKKQSHQHRIEFEINYDKAIEAVLYVLAKSKSKAPVNLYTVLKIIFEADKTHLKLHGRPVTGDTYIKMEHGTVPSSIYDMIKGDPAGLAELGIKMYPFEKVDGYYLKAKRKPNLDCFSESDLEALEQGIKKYLHLSFSQVKAKNHEEKCWIESEMNQPIDFALLIEDQEMLETLQNSPLRLVV